MMMRRKGNKANKEPVKTAKTLFSTDVSQSSRKRNRMTNCMTSVSAWWTLCTQNASSVAPTMKTPSAANMCWITQMKVKSSSSSVARSTNTTKTAIVMKLSKTKKNILPVRESCVVLMIRKSFSSIRKYVARTFPYWTSVHLCQKRKDKS